MNSIKENFKITNASFGTLGIPLIMNLKHIPMGCLLYLMSLHLKISLILNYAEEKTLNLNINSLHNSSDYCHFKAFSKIKPIFC
jgi:hypothetical protein